MPKLTKRTADSAKARAQDYFIWDDERRVKDLTKADINKILKDVMAGKTNCSFKT